MKKLSWTLGIIASLLALSTAYFARELHLERASHAAVAAAPAEASAGIGARSTSTPAGPPDSQELAATKDTVATNTAVSPDFPFAVTTASGNRQQPTREQMKQAAIEESRKFLAELATSEGRARLLEQQKLITSSGREGMAEYLQMDPGQYSQFVDFVAGQELALRESATRCFLDPKCRYRGETAEWTEARNQEMASMFGSEVVERYLFFQRSGNERNAVAKLRGRLPDRARLSDAKADELVRAWVDETQRITDDMARVGYGISLSNGMVYEVAEADPDGKRAAAVDDYNRRWRDRAAGLLTSEQLGIFTQMQQEVLEQARGFNALSRTAN